MRDFVEAVAQSLRNMGMNVTVRWHHETRAFISVNGQDVSCWTRISSRRAVYIANTEFRRNRGRYDVSGAVVAIVSVLASRREEADREKNEARYREQLSSMCGGGWQDRKQTYTPEPLLTRELDPKMAGKTPVTMSVDRFGNFKLTVSSKDGGMLRIIADMLMERMY